MKCYNCGSELTNYDICPYCGANVSAFNRIVKMSNTYYNMGLAKASNRDLQGAAYMLRRSVKLYKNQITARNLLGLVYYEMGETVQALSEWVISKYLQPDGNLASYYIDTIQANQNKLQAINQTISKFNVALNYAKTDAEDMAIIQLKKVLVQNPNLVKGHQLLALLYYHQGEYLKARKAIKKALSVDKCNTLSLKYMREIDAAFDEKMRLSGKRRKERKKEREKYLSGDEVIIPKRSWYQNSGVASMLCLMGGVLLGLLVTYFVVMPGRLTEQSESYLSEQSDYNQQILQLNTNITLLTNELEDSEAQVESLQEQIGSLTEELDQAKSDLEAANEIIHEAGLDEEETTEEGETGEDDEEETSETEE
ncbi:MAG: hypothetical protein LUE29_06205 [Lachnospiraceae bacterium]|nr:hypothetical protein [Lachnospiraceae bacterium]